MMVVRGVVLLCVSLLVLFFSSVGCQLRNIYYFCSVLFGCPKNKGAITIYHTGSGNLQNGCTEVYERIRYKRNIFQ